MKATYIIFKFKNCSEKQTFSKGIYAQPNADSVHFLPKISDLLITIIHRIVVAERERKREGEREGLNRKHFVEFLLANLWKFNTENFSVKIYSRTQTRAKRKGNQSKQNKIRFYMIRVPWNRPYRRNVSIRQPKAPHV